MVGRGVEAGDEPTGRGAGISYGTADVASLCSYFASRARCPRVQARINTFPPVVITRYNRMQYRTTTIRRVLARYCTARATCAALQDVAFPFFFAGNHSHNARPCEVPCGRDRSSQW